MLKSQQRLHGKAGLCLEGSQKKPHLKPMPPLIQKSYAGKSVIGSRVEHVFADQQSEKGPFVRTIGITRATMRIGLSNIVYNMSRFLFLERLNGSAWPSSGQQFPIRSKRRSKTTLRTKNQVAKSLKTRASASTNSSSSPSGLIRKFFHKLPPPPPPMSANLYYRT